MGTDLKEVLENLESLHHHFDYFLECIGQPEQKGTWNLRFDVFKTQILEDFGHTIKSYE